MAKRRLYRVLSRIVEIKPGEETIALLLFLYFFIFQFAYYIIKPVRDAKYLIEEGSLRLPFAYLLTAVFMGFFIHFYSTLQVRVHRRVLIISSLVFFIVTCFISTELFRRDVSWVPLVFWIWANAFITVLLTQFFLLINDIFNPREAKRLIGFIISGGILGGGLGGLLTGYLAKKYPENVLFIACGVLVVALLVVNYIFIWRKKNRAFVEASDLKTIGEERLAKAGFKECFDIVRKNDYLKLLAGIVTITFIVSTFIDWQSKTVIQMNYEIRKDLMIRFFGYFHAGLLVFPFLLSLLITSNIIKRLGMRLTLLVYPLVMLLGSISIATSGIVASKELFVLGSLSAAAIVPLHFFIFAITIEGCDKTLSFSLNQSVRELLYIPISPELKNRAKLFIDMFLNRFAKGIGAVVLLLFYFYPDGWPMSAFIKDWRIRVVITSIFILVFIFFWIRLNGKVHDQYTNTVKEKLKTKWERADRLVAEKVDVDYTKLIFDTLESRDRSSVLYAMHLFDLIKQDKLTPEVRKLISYRSDEVRATSLGPLMESDVTPLIPETDEFLSEEVMEKEIGEIMSLGVYQEVMKSYVEKAIKDKTQDSETAKMEVAKAIGLMDSDSLLIDKLEELLWDESPGVSKYAIESAAKIRRKEYVPILVRKLINPATQEDAGAALEKYGAKITGTLGDYLNDSKEDISLRKRVASVLARIGIQEAADFLIWELARDKREMDTELIDALDRIRSEKPEIQFQTQVIREKILKDIKRHYQMIIDLYDLVSAEGQEKEGKDLEKKLSFSLMNIFKLLGLIYPREDIAKAYQNIRTGTKDSLAYGVELLDNLLEKGIRDRVFPLVEDLSLEQRVKMCLNLLRSFIDK